MGLNEKHIEKILLAVIGAFFISFLLMNTVFTENTSKPNWDTLAGKTARLKSSILQQGFNLTALLAKLSIEKTIPTQQAIVLPSPAIPTLIPTPPPHTIIPTSSVQTALPTSIPTPTFFLYPTLTPEPKPTTVPFPTYKPTSFPTIKPTKSVSPTSPPPVQPTAPPQIPDPGVPVITNPLQQPWYGNGSMKCYTPARFIQVYANGLTPNACYNNVKAAVESQLTTVKLLGRTITVHNKAYPAFKAVADTLEVYKKDGTHYAFPSKTYEIRNVGAYYFRCNTNASTGNPLDTCQSGCVIGTHAFGIAVDINYDTNPNGSTNYDMPKEIVDAFEKYGFRWGGRYPLLGSKIDAMHFEYMVQLCEGI